MATSPFATTLELVRYEEWEVPDFVRRIRIKMANDEEYVIESQAPQIQSTSGYWRLKRVTRLAGA